MTVEDNSIVAGSSLNSAEKFLSFLLTMAMAPVGGSHIFLCWGTHFCVVAAAAMYVNLSCVSAKIYAPLSRDIARMSVVANF